MEMRTRGMTGLSISPTVLGGNVFGSTVDETTSFDLLDAFFDAGFNAIDTADVYSAWLSGNKGGDSEEIIGKWLKKGTVSRDKAIVISKVGLEVGPGKTGLTEEYILRAPEDSLRRLQADYIDLCLSHWPDPETPYDLAGSAKAVAQRKRLNDATCSTQCRECLRRKPPCEKVDVSKRPRGIAQ
jgi:aryl-alcohol dehydrogenase-like predicted oxidoreductase